MPLASSGPSMLGLCAGLLFLKKDGWPGFSVMRRVPRPRVLRAGLEFGFFLVDQHKKQVNTGWRVASR